MIRYFIIILFLLSCNNKQGNKHLVTLDISKVTNKEKTSDLGKVKLLSYSNERIMEVEEYTEYYDNREKVIKPYKTIKYKNDSIIIGTAHLINSCGETKGVISINDSTIYLLTERVSNLLCASVELHKYKYIVSNPMKKKYKINY